MRRLPARIGWEVKVLYGRAVRRLGIGRALALVLAAGILAMIVILATQRQALFDLTQRQAELSEVAHRYAAPVQSQNPSDAQSRLRQFAGYLTKHEDIPVVVGDVLRQAEDEGLSIQRGDYRPQIDGPGGFLRYRMNLPVTGKPDAMHRFIQAALVAHRSLALESIHFGRERTEAGQIEARLQWTLFTGLPVNQDIGAPDVREMR
jgi:hypothetical protein